MKKQIRDKIKMIKLLATDVDGTLTDGGMYYCLLYTSDAADE